MSTLPGGPADKAGNIHEALWGVVGMSTVLGGQADAIRIEEPGTDGAEFYLEKAGIHEHWQAKRQVLSQKTWSLQLLKSEGILSFFRQRIDVGESCVFASITDAPEFRGLAENARDAQDWDEFQSKFLSTERWKEHFNELEKYLGYPASGDVFKFLRQVRVEGARESTLEALLLPIFKASFTGQPRTALAILRDFYTASVHRKLTADDIVRHLNSHSIHARTLPINAGLRDFLQGITAAYTAGQRTKLIRGGSIPRQAAVDIVERMKVSKRSLDILITAPAGGGKSAGLLQVVTGLAAAGVPVLAFRLDRVEPVASTEALGQKLNLPESPAIVLSQCYPGQAVAVVIDQLDFVSATSGRHPDFFEVVAALAEEVRGLRASRQIHLVTACRQFDFEHDSRIRRLLPPNETPVSLGLLSVDEVKREILADGGDPAKLSNKQMDLLRLPQNLSLFIDSEIAKSDSPSFVSQKELLDLYWETKRRAVLNRHPEDSAQWSRIIAKLTDEMSSREELSVPKARLDEFSPEFLAVMATEGVLSVEGQRYGFGHESLFDYCFARNVAANNTEFVTLLESDQQELFRRAQLRQVLVYLRDDDFQRYLRNVKQAFASKKLRPHLKVLVMELVAAFPDPRDEELGAFMPYLDREFAARRSSVSSLTVLSPKKPFWERVAIVCSGILDRVFSRKTRQQPADKMAARGWAVFFASRTLFMVADRLGYITRWLNSGEDWLLNQMAYYLRWQAELHGDRVAELLEPFVGKGGGWNDRMRHIMEWVQLGKSRRFFDLFLRLLDNGTLDNARGPIAVNSTFWSLLHRLAKDQPGWYAEVATHWLNRQAAVAIASAVDGQKPSVRLDDPFGARDLIESAKAAPQMFIEHLLPAVMHVASAHAYGDKNGLLRDTVWPIRFRGEHITLSEAYITSCETAIEQIGAANPKSLIPLIASLRLSRLNISNHFIQVAYLTAPAVFADEAMTLLVDEPERFHCGFSDSPFWVARTLIKKCSLHCSQECFQKLETVILAFTTPHELSEDGSPHRGYSAYTLASALALNRCSTEAQSQLQAWQKIFGGPPAPPRGIRSFEVVSPIPKEEAKAMSDDQWLEAIAKYNTERGLFDFNNPGRGGASEFAALFHEFAKNEPDRIARLAIRLPKDTNASYFMNILYGLKTEAVNPQLKLDVARRVFESDQTACLMAALDLLATIVGLQLPEDAVQFIRKMATEHPDPEPDDAQDDDLLFRGVNSVRGHGVEAIRDLIIHDKAYLPVFSSTIEHCVHDASLAVRACAASTIHAVAYYDPAKAIVLFKQLLETDDRLLAAPYVERFLNHGLRQHPSELRAVVERMLRSENEKARQAGGRLACLGRLYHPNLNDLSEMAITGNPTCRLGATEVANQNLILPTCRSWCEAVLHRLFNDGDAGVRRNAAHCFWHLWQQPELPLVEYDGLIRSFLASPSFAEEPTFLLHALDETRQPVPETILDVCEVFVAKCSEQARDITTSMAGDEATVGKLVFRAYAQLKTMPLRKRALNLIDEMCAEGLQSAGTHLTEFER